MSYFFKLVNLNINAKINLTFVLSKITRWAQVSSCKNSAYFSVKSLVFQLSQEKIICDKVIDNGEKATSNMYVYKTSSSLVPLVLLQNFVWQMTYLAWWSVHDTSWQVTSSVNSSSLLLINHSIVLSTDNLCKCRLLVTK